MFKGVFKAVFGDPNLKEIKKLEPLVDEVNKLEDEMKVEREEKLQQMRVEFYRVKVKSEEVLQQMRTEFYRDLAEKEVWQNEIENLRQRLDHITGQGRHTVQTRIKRLEKQSHEWEDELLEKTQVLLKVAELHREMEGACEKLAETAPKAELEDLQQQVTEATGQDRRQLQAQLEQAEKQWREWEDELQQEIALRDKIATLRAKVKRLYQKLLQEIVIRRIEVNSLQQQLTNATDQERLQLQAQLEQAERQLSERADKLLQQIYSWQRLAELQQKLDGLRQNNREIVVQRARAQDLRQQVVKTTDQEERRQLEAQLEQAKKGLLKQERELLQKMQAEIFAVGELQARLESLYQPRQAQPTPAKEPQEKELLQQKAQLRDSIANLWAEIKKLHQKLLKETVVAVNNLQQQMVETTDQEEWQLQAQQELAEKPLQEQEEELLQEIYGWQRMAELRQQISKFRREIAEETVAQRAEAHSLRQQVIEAAGQERQQLQVQLEQAEKQLLKQEEELLQEIQAEVFAAVREASQYAIGMRHYDVQIVGGMILHQGKVVEMRTGEGKTLAATMPVALNALMGRGVHVITVNDYLAKRDCQWMGPIYHFLGLTISVIQNAGGGGVDKASFQFDPDYHSDDDRYQNLRPITRREAYHCDITYGTNNEFGFDYLRDNMVPTLERLVQRELHYCIIDEVDNILIDEARTPLIISGQAEESSELYKRFAQLVRVLKRSSDKSVEDEELEPDGDYVVDEKARVAYLTEQGVERIESSLGVENLYEGESAAMTPYLDNALRAHALFKLDVDYVVQNGEVIIVDEFTGRLMHGRRYSEGLHQAIEAKEGVNVRHESFTWATITLQNLFRMYNKLAGMTGTAETEAEEFADIYELDVTVLPTNVEYRALRDDLIKESIKEDGAEITTYRSEDGSEFYYKRVDYPDVVYKTPPAKFKAVAEEIKALQQAERPVLVGTIAIETSEYLSKLLNKQGIKHEVLNAKQHEREATIITQAGRPGAVTIATNMAGRGVDILLGGNAEGLARDELRRRGEDLTKVAPELWEKTLNKWTTQVAKDKEKVLDMGGLHVIGTERHDARRIDNQLRGRAGRQGDPGSSRFYVSLQDDLMRRFGGQSVANLMERFGVDDDIPIEAGIVSKSIENSQTKVEGHNFDIRKHLLKYDDVINQQREVMYAERRRILSSSSLKESVQNLIAEELSSLAHNFVTGEFPEEWDLTALHSAVRTIMPLPATLTSNVWANMAPEQIEDQILELAEKNYKEMEEIVGLEQMRLLEKQLMQRVLDTLWVRHLTALDSLREGIGLRAVGQQDPLVAYKKEAFEMYGQLRDTIKEEIVRMIYHAPNVQREAPQPRNIKAMHPSAMAAGQAETPGATKQSPVPVRVQKTLGRNDPCHCGSGKKYKQCHMKSDMRGGNGQGARKKAAGGKTSVGGNKNKGKKKKRIRARKR